MISSAGVPQNYPAFLGTDYKARIIKGLTEAKEGGINTIVDATTFDLGRDVSVLAEASRQTGVNIVACTGWYSDIPRMLSVASVDQFAQLFIREIQDGIAGTDVKAGIIKAASDILGVTRDSETILRAIARAHLQTDVPIMLHSYSPGQVGKQQLAILKEEGVDLRRVKLDHSNDTTDVEYLTWLLEQGCYLGMDRYPGGNLIRLTRVRASPLARTKTMKALIDAGYADRLLPSHDWALVWVILDTLPTFREEREKINPYGYLYIKKVVFPQLREMGVSEVILNSLCVNGPRNFFEGP
jgi:phosphotriesterase-related protein